MVSLGIYLFLGANSCRGASRSRKTFSTSEQLMSVTVSADKYPSIFSGQMGAIVYVWHRVLLHVPDY